MKPRPDAMDRLVARRIRQERIAAGVTQRELAEAAGVMTQQIAKFEGEVDRVKAGQLYLIAQRIGTPIDELFKENRRYAAGQRQLRFVRATRQVPARLIEPLAHVVRALNGRAS